MSRRRFALPASWWVPIPIVLLSLLLYWPFVFGGKTLFWGTALLQFWPWRQLAAEQMSAGQLPLWNPFSGSGVPLLADHQTAIFYPLNLIFWLLPVERAMGLSLVLHAILAGLAMYALARELQVSRLGGLVAALAFAFSGYMVARGSFLTEISALPWLPLLWLYGRRVLHRRRIGDAALLALVVALQFLAGHAQTWFYSLCALALYGAWEGLRFAKEPGEGRRHEVAMKWRAAAASGSEILPTMRGAGPLQARAEDPAALASLAQRRPPRSLEKIRSAAQAAARAAARYLPLAAAVAWGVSLAAVQFLPTLELSSVAVRPDRQGWESYALQYSMWPWRLITLLLPDFFGNPARGDYWGYATYWEDAGYIGVLPFVLALLAIVSWAFGRRRQRTAAPALASVPFFASLALFALLMALGKNTPVYMIFFRYIPGFRTFQAPARWLAVYTPAMALLAGIGVDALRPSRRLAFVCRLAVAGAAAIALTTLAARSLLPDVKATFFGPLVQFALLFGASMLLFLWGQAAREGRALRAGPPRLGHAAWQVAVFSVVAADLLFAGYTLNPAMDASLYESQTQIGAFLAGDGPQGRTFYRAEGREKVTFGRHLDFGDYGPPGATSWWGLREALPPDLGIVEHLPSANTFEPLVEGRYQALLQAVDQAPLETAMRVLGAMNVAYLLDPDPGLAYEKAYSSPEVNVYRNPYVLPRAYIVCQARTAGSAEEALALLFSAGFDPAREVVLEHADPLPAANASDTPCQAQPAAVLLSTPNQVTIQAALSQPGYLVLADTFYPGWQALVGGRTLEIQRANYALRAVPLPAGEHEVVFRYRPLSLSAGLACTAIALAGVLAAGLRAWVRRRRPA